MRKKANLHWERIDRVISQTNFTINGFARYICLKSGENLYQIQRGNNGISLNVAKRIHAKFPQISITWLLTGLGELSDGTIGLPLYDNIWSLVNDRLVDSSKIYLSEKFAYGAECAVLYTDDGSLCRFSSIPAVLLLRKGRDQEPLQEKLCYVVTKNVCMLLVAEKDDDPLFMKFKHPYNPINTLSFPWTDVLSLWVVCGLHQAMIG